MKRLLVSGLLVILLAVASSTPMFSTGDSLVDPTLAFAGGNGNGGGNGGGSEDPAPPTCTGDSHVVVKLDPGTNVAAINSKYGTETVRQFPGVDIYVLRPAGGGTGASTIAGRMSKHKNVVWVEVGQLGGNNADADGFSAAVLDQFTQAALDQFTAAALDGFSTAALDQFTVATLDQFTAAVLDQFSLAALDGFSQAALDQFSQAILDQFSQAILDQFSQAALDQFSPAVLDQFTQAALDGFTAAALDQFSAAALGQFTVAMLDQFSAAALDGFSAAVLDGFSAAILDQFTQAALDGFSVAALDQFSQAALDGFSAAVLDQFTQAVLDQFSTAILDQFTVAMLDGFSTAILDQFTVAVMDQFTQAALDGFSAAILDQFSTAILDQFTLAALDQFTLGVLDQFMAAVLDQFTFAYFHSLTVQALDAEFGATARSQSGLAAINAPQALLTSTGAGVVVAVIDSGISDHWYLNSQIAPGGYDFVDFDADPADETNGIDDDGDGMVDESFGHGTHVAGIVNLVAPDAMILPIRVQDSDGGRWSFIMAEAIQYAVDQGADVINLSLGVSCPSKVLEWAVDYAAFAGVTVVAAAGNTDSPNVHYPAAYYRTIAVAALEDTGVKASFSNYNAYVDISAPGVGVYSTFGEGQFAWWSGTSQATPMIAGAAALLLEINPTLYPAYVSDLLGMSAQDVDPLNPGYEGQLGYGMANLALAVAIVP